MGSVNPEKLWRTRNDASLASENMIAISYNKRTMDRAM
jgi:hypothetical protein